VQPDPLVPRVIKDLQVLREQPARKVRLELLVQQVPLVLKESKDPRVSLEPQVHRGSRGHLASLGP
jgi:hypothetical protein